MMKKILFMVMIFLFTATVTSYAGIYRSESGDNDRQYGALYGNSNGSPEEDSGYGGIFRSSNKPVNRPGNSEGLGQSDSAPLADGLPVFVTCCVILAVVKGINENRKKGRKPENEN